MSPIYLLLRQMGEFLKAEIKGTAVHSRQTAEICSPKVFVFFAFFSLHFSVIEDCEGFMFYNIGHQMQYYIGVLTSFPQNKHFRQN